MFLKHLVIIHILLASSLSCKEPATNSNKASVNMTRVDSSLAGEEIVSFLPISCRAKSEKVDLFLQPTNELKVLDVQEIDKISVIDKVESRYKVKINGEISLVEITSLDCK